MDMQTKRVYCLNEKEFLMCASLSGIRHVTGFEMSAKPDMTDREITESAFEMVKSGFLKAGNGEGLEFIPEFSELFSLIRESKGLILVHQKAEKDPFAILYPGKRDFVELQREQYGEGYVRVCLWKREELGLWLEEKDIRIPADLPVELSHLLKPMKDSGSVEQMPQEWFGWLEGQDAETMDIVWNIRLYRKLFYPEISLRRGTETEAFPYSMTELVERLNGLIEEFGRKGK